MRPFKSPICKIVDCSVSFTARSNTEALISQTGRTAARWVSIWHWETQNFSIWPVGTETQHSTVLQIGPLRVMGPGPYSACTGREVAYTSVTSHDTCLNEQSCSWLLNSIPRSSITGAFGWWSAWSTNLKQQCLTTRGWDLTINYHSLEASFCTSQGTWLSYDKARELC